MERNLRPLHSEVRVALICNRSIFLQQDLHPALSGRKIVNLPPIAERERRDVLRDPEPARSTVAAVLEYQVVAVLQVGAVPLDLVDAPHQPDFSAVRLGNGQRWRVLHTISPTSVQELGVAVSTLPAPNDHFPAGPDCRVMRSGVGRVGGAGGYPTIRVGIVSSAGIEELAGLPPPNDHFTAGPDCRVP